MSSGGDVSTVVVGVSAGRAGRALWAGPGVVVGSRAVDVGWEDVEVAILVDGDGLGRLARGDWTGEGAGWLGFGGVKGRWDMRGSMEWMKRVICL